MATPEDVAALEAHLPWLRDDFRADLAALASSAAAASRVFAADARVLSRLAAQVPRCARDETGGTPWTSFRAEVAVARSVSMQAAAREIRTALRLTSVLPHTLDLLDAGRITVLRAKVLVEELEVYDDELAAQLDADLADHAARLSSARIKDAVRKAALALDPDSAALRTATRTAGRTVGFWPLEDGQACVVVTGPATPLTRWHATLDARARALRAAGDPRTLDALRFDLATSTYPCATHAPAAPDAEDSRTRSSTAGDGASRTQAQAAIAAELAAGDSAPAGLRLSGVEAAPVDCRRSRPVQAMIVLPVETALGLSNEPAWLDGYGWLDAPTSRTLLIDSELRQVCADRSTGQLLDLASRDLRPPPTPDGVRTALLDLVHDDLELTDQTCRTEPQHDPSQALRTFTALRDRTCDGPTQTSAPASRCDQDHDQPWPTGPTAAWNLVSRSRRTHALKHCGWTPIRTAHSTIWTSPAGQVVEVPRTITPPPGIDPDPDGRTAELPEASALAEVDTYQLTAPTDDDTPPWVPPQQRPEPTTWRLVEGSDDPPF